MCSKLKEETELSTANNNNGDAPQSSAPHKSSGLSKTAIENYLVGWGIQPKDLEMYIRALTHKSDFARSGAHFNNEKLEFLGDAVLDLVLADVLMGQFPKDNEGQLSRKKAALVKEATLSQLALAMGLDEQIIMGANEWAQGMNRNQRLLASVFEALVGAIYLDLGYSQVFTWLEDQFQSRLLSLLEEPDSLTDHKTKLQEVIQAQSKQTPSYRVINAEGPDHQRRFEVEVEVSGQVLGRGSGTSKKTAAQEAAKNALKNRTDRQHGSPSGEPMSSSSSGEAVGPSPQGEAAVRPPQGEPVDSSPQYESLDKSFKPKPSSPQGGTDG